MERQSVRSGAKRLERFGVPSKSRLLSQRILDAPIEVVGEAERSTLVCTSDRHGRPRWPSQDTRPAIPRYTSSQSQELRVALIGDAVHADGPSRPRQARGPGHSSAAAVIDVVGENAKASLRRAASAHVLHDHAGRMGGDHGRSNSATVGLTHQEDRIVAGVFRPIDVGVEPNSVPPSASRLSRARAPAATSIRRPP